MRKAQTLLAGLLFASCLCGWPSVVVAKEASDLILISEAPSFAQSFKESENIVISEVELTPEEMQNLRGGFIDPTGLIYNFAVNVQTAFNGAEVFSRYITVSPAADGQLQAMTASTLIPQNIPKTLGINMIEGGNGLSVTDANGNRTMLINQSASGIPMSMVLNTISNSNITQFVDMTLTLNHLASVLSTTRLSVQNALAQNAAMRSLGF